MSARPASAPLAERRTGAGTVATRRATARRRALLRRMPRPSRLLAWLIAALLGHTSLALAQVAPSALPSGGKVVVGSAQLQQSPNQLVIQQQSSNLGLDWQSFNIGSGASVQFVQPSASSIALNRVVGNSASQIYGHLQANGQVFLVNPNGVLFARGAKVDVGGMVASTLDLSQQDFAAGRYAFGGSSGASVVNQGQLHANAGGYLALFGNKVDNQGTVTVDAGSVVLASGRAATISISGSGLISAVVTPGAQGGVANSGSLIADGGTVTLSAHAAQGIAASLVNNTGIVRADTLVERNGQIWITGDQVSTTGQVSADAGSRAAAGAAAGSIAVVADKQDGNLRVGGTLSARSVDGSGAGGNIETSAARVRIDAGAQVDTRGRAGAWGTWTVDPTDFTISAGSGAQTDSGIGADTLSGNLATANVALTTDPSGTQAGDIDVDAAVAWSANTTLTLTAANNININANISATGNTAGLVLTPGSGGAYLLNHGAQVTLSGSSPTLTIAGNSYTVVNSLAALQAIDGDSTALAGFYALGSDIDATSSGNMNGGAGFNPIGNENNPTYYYGGNFTGRFDGLNHTISGLTTNMPGAAGVGLFAGTNAADIRNLQLAGGSVLGDQYAGALIGYAYNTTVSNVHSSNAVTALSNNGGTVFAGGLIGEQDHYVTATAVNGSSTSGTVFAEGGSVYAGGLEGYFYGYCYGNGSCGGIASSSSSSPVTATIDSYWSYVGGLVGSAYSSGGIANSSASGSINVTENGSAYYYGTYAGGLVGYDYYSPLTGSISASGAVSLGGDPTSYSSRFAGGLVGYMSSGGIPAGASASGSVSGAYYAGGLVGDYEGSTDLSNVSATGNVSGSGYVGGLVGYNSSGAGISTSFASGNVTASSYGYAGGLVGYAYTSTSTGISDSSATGNVSGYYAGGLVGSYYVASSSAGGISNSGASGQVNGSYYAGGLAGYVCDCYSSSAAGNAIGSSHATGSVNGNNYVGGLVGSFNGYRPISDSYATGNVTLNASSNNYYLADAGGLVGQFYNYGTSGSAGGIVRSFASGSVAVVGANYNYYYNQPYAGGLVGILTASSAGSQGITDSYATGNVSVSGNNVSTDIGGLVGYQQNGSIANAYSTGAVSSSVTGSGTQSLGGLVGVASGSVTTTNSYWSTDESGLSTSAGGTGLTSAQMSQAASFNGWSIASTGGGGTTWRIYEGFTMPLLSGLLTPVTISLADASKVYDGTGSLAGVSLSSPNGTVAHPETIFAAISSSDVGNYSVAAADLYSTQFGYDLTVTGSGTLTITQRPLTLAGVVVDKVYDGTTNATLSSTGAPSGLVPGQSLTVDTANVSALFSDKNVGSGKTVTLTGYTLSDGVNGKASNYSLADSTTTTASITPAPLTAGSFAATDRSYDGTTTVAVTATPSSNLQGVFGNDQVSVSLSNVSTGTMADKNVGSTKPVTVIGAQISGADAGNYTIAGIDGVTVNISPLTLTANGITASDRNYNAGTAVSLSGTSATLSGAVQGDLVDFQRNALVGNTADANAATGKSVTVTGLNLIGPDAANYTLQAGSVSVNITPLPITVYAYANAQTNKVYDGTTTANVSLSYTNYDGANLVVNDTGVNYSDKNVGSNKTITVAGISLSGSAAGNYSLSNTSTTTYGTITPKSLTVTGVTAENRVYDATVNVNVEVANAQVDPSGVIPGDSVSVQAPQNGVVVGTMADKNVGTAKPVTVPGLTLTGTDAGNYTLSGTNGVTVDITQKTLTASYVGIDKVYDGTAYAQVTASSTDVIAGDQVSFYSNYYNYCACNGSIVFTGTGAKNVGTAKPISITYDYIYGTDAANYNFVNAGTGTTTASITAKNITAAFTGNNKVYDGTTAATVTLNTSGSGIYYNDAVGATDTATFTDSGGKNVGNNKTISVSNIALTGTDASNYTLASTTATTSANVTALPVTISGITATNRAYDGTVDVALTAGNVTSSGFINGDNVSVSLPQGGVSTGTMADKNVGTAKPVTVTGLSLTGTDAANYSILGTSTTVDITQLGLTVGYTGVDRVYNGGITASVVASAPSLIPGDAVGFTQTAVFSGTGGKNVGTAKSISVTNIALTGADAANYTLLNTTASTTANITPKAITVAYTAADRVYDGSADTGVSVSGSSSGLIAGDIVSFSQNAAFATDGSAGVAKTVAVSSIALGGSDAANYSLSSTNATTTATITQRPIGITGITATNRVYDGTTVVAVNVADAQADPGAIISGDSVAVVLPPDGITTGTTADRNAGNNKPVTVDGLGITGTSAANYTLTGATGLVVNITPLTVTASYSASDRVYDGTVNAAVAGSSSGFLSIDAGTVSVAASGSFTGTHAKDVGTAKTVTVANAYLTGASSGNYLLANTGGSTTASITPLALTPSYAGTSQVYDGSTTAQVVSTTGGIVAGDQISFGQAAVFTGNGAKNVGSNKSIEISGITLGGADAIDYSLTTTTASASGNVTPKPITIDGLNGITATNRVYDGTTTVAVNVPNGSNLTPDSSDIVAGDNVTVNLPQGGISTGTMADKNVGNGKSVAITGLTLSGSDAMDYVIAGTAGLSVDITPLALTAVYTGLSKVYDGTASASVTGSSADILAGDNLTISGSGVFTGAGAKNVGNGKAINVTSASLGGTDAINYALVNATGTATADITPRSVTVVYTGGTKVYDGTTAAPVTAAASGLIANDVVSLTQTAVFGGSGAKNVGTNKEIDVSGISLVGSDAANYALMTTSATTAGGITPKPLAIDGLTGVTATNRVYDGTNIVQVTVTTSGPLSPDPADLVPGDVVTVTAPIQGATTGTTVDKNVGSGKSVTVSGITLGGADGGNYSVAATAGVTVDITPKDLFAAYTGVDKIYDGSAAASVLGASSDILGGDNVSISASGVFTGTGAKNVGTAKTIAVQSATLGGTDASNYTLTDPTGTTTASITPKAVTATYTGGSRVYDGTTAAPVTGNASGFIGGDSVSLSQNATFVGSGAKDVGTGKAVDVGSISLQGLDATNYVLTDTSATTTATITPKPLTIDGLTGVTVANRVYDGTNVVAVTIGSNGPLSPDPADIVPGDVVTVNTPQQGSTIGTMADKNVGTNKSVAITGLTLGGADAIDYMISATAGLTVDITPLGITAAYTGIDKVYDGTAAASVVGASSGIIGGDSVTIGGSGVFTGNGAKNVGTGKTIAVQTASLSSTDAGNYTLLDPTGTATASITPRPVTAIYVGGTKVYDATDTAPVSATASGLIDGDRLGLTQTAVFLGNGAKNVGTGKAVQVSDIALTGSDAANYSLVSSTATTTASITPRPLDITGLTGISAVDRVYDGTTGVQIVTSGPIGSGSGSILAGDQVTINMPQGGVSAGTMADKNAGNNKAVVLSGITLGGADAANYQITGTAGVTVSIAPKPVVLLGLAAVNRVYDATDVVAIDTSGGTISGVIAGDSLTLLTSGATGTMSDKNVGNGKAVALTGLALGGSDAGNYVASSGGSLSVNITPFTLQAGAVAADKVYDGTRAATVSLSDNVFSGDAVTLGSASATFASKDPGANQAVTISGLNLSGVDAGNYLLAATSLSATAKITPAPLIISAPSMNKIYGDSLNLGSTGFAAQGLVPGESIGQVTLASAGAAAGANVAGGPYTVSIANASGGSFNPIDYAISYQPGQLSVTPRPLTVASNSLVRYADQPNPGSFGFSTSVGGLVGGDSISSVLLAAPAGSANAPGGSVFELVPSGAVFGSGSASNYALSYADGLLVVLPVPPRLGSPEAQSAGNGDVNFAIQLDPAQLQSAQSALDTAAATVAQPAPQRESGAAQPAVLADAAAPPPDLSILLAGDARQITLPALQHLPLLSLDPRLQSLISGRPAPATGPAGAAAPGH